jgi:hypothetical protein
MERSFFAGLEEALARIIGFIITTALSCIFVLARGTMTFDWLEMAGALSLFWFLYEVISYALYLAFVYFAKQRNQIKEGLSSNNELETDL